MYRGSIILGCAVDLDRLLRRNVLSYKRTRNLAAHPSSAVATTPELHDMILRFVGVVVKNVAALAAVAVFGSRRIPHRVAAAACSDTAPGGAACRPPELDDRRDEPDRRRDERLAPGRALGPARRAELDTSQRRRSVGHHHAVAVAAAAATAATAAVVGDAARGGVKHERARVPTEHEPFRSGLVSSRKKATETTQGAVAEGDAHSHAVAKKVAVGWRPSVDVPTSRARSSGHLPPMIGAPPHNANRL